MNDNSIHKDDSLLVGKLSKGNLIAINTLFMEYSLHQYLIGLVD